MMSLEGGMTPGGDDRMNRRGFLSITGIAAVATILGVAPVGRVVYAAALTRAQRDKLTPDDIIALMKKGNERFRLGQESPHDYLAQQKGSAKGQYPAAVILSCIDSRAPAETIMDLGIGDCFNARVAGNIANDDIVGSMEFACKVAGAKVVLVMGHTACGAIKGAIDKVQLGWSSSSVDEARWCRPESPPWRISRPSRRVEDVISVRRSSEGPIPISVRLTASTMTKVGRFLLSTGRRSHCPVPSHSHIAIMAQSSGVEPS